MFNKTIFKQTLAQNWKLWLIFTVVASAISIAIISTFDPHAMRLAVQAFGAAMIAPHEDIADLIIRMDSYKQLYAAMEKLSEVHRRRVYLYHFCDLTCREIARVENVHYSTISRSLRQALEVLKGYITE